MINLHTQKNNKSGFAGVFWYKSLNKWAAQITVNKKIIHLGCFNKKSNAIKAREKAEKVYFPKSRFFCLPLRSLCKLFNIGHATIRNEAIRIKIKPDIEIGTRGLYSLNKLNKIIERLQDKSLIEISNDNSTYKQSKFIKDIIGTKYGRLTAIKRLEEKTPKGGAIWLWHCDCGKLVIIQLNNVAHTKSRDKKSCGCIRKEQYAKLNNFLGVTNIEGTCVERILSTNLSKRNKSGVKGVFWDNSRKQWCARIAFQGKYYHLGRFSDKEKAARARQEAEKKLYEPFLEWYYKNRNNKKEPLRTTYIGVGEI